MKVLDEYIKYHDYKRRSKKRNVQQSTTNIRVKRTFNDVKKSIEDFRHKNEESVDEEE